MRAKPLDERRSSHGRASRGAADDAVEGAADAASSGLRRSLLDPCTAETAAVGGAVIHRTSLDHAAIEAAALMLFASAADSPCTTAVVLRATALVICATALVVLATALVILATALVILAIALVILATALVLCAAALIWPRRRRHTASGRRGVWLR